MADTSGAGAASVASQLLAFLREPARFRPRYIHGEDRLPEGHDVLKIALGRFAHGWQRDLSQQDRHELVDAARAFVRQVCLWERATHYQLLCLEPGAGREEIKENYRLLMALLHPDRQDAADHEWPVNCAQRVNEAYAVLSDDRTRSEYGAGLERVHAAPFNGEAAQGFRAPRMPRRGDFLRPFLVVTGVLSALFIVQSWWVGDVPRHYTLLEHAMPLQASARWMGEVLPRFLYSKPAFEFETLDPLPAARPPQLATTAAWVPARGVEPAVDAARPPALIMGQASAESTSPPASKSELAPAPRLRLAQVAAPTAAVAAASPATVVAQAAASNAPGSPSAEQIEILVARLVSHYEAGNTDALMALFDPDEMGFWKGLRTRSRYSDFFRATKQRQLRMNQLTWNTAPQSARARGEALVIAEYADGRGKREQKVGVELDIAVRNGQALIGRLSLYPDEN